MTVLNENKIYIYEKRDGDYILVLNEPWPKGKVLAIAFTRWGARRKAKKLLKGSLPKPERVLVEVVTESDLT